MRIVRKTLFGWAVLALAAMPSYGQYYPQAGYGQPGLGPMGPMNYGPANYGPAPNYGPANYGPAPFAQPVGYVRPDGSPMYYNAGYTPQGAPGMMPMGSGNPNMGGGNARPASLAANNEEAKSDTDSSSSSGSPSCSSSSNCDDSGCGNACHGCCRCADMFEHTTGVWGDFLYLRAFGVDMAHGLQENVSQSGIGTVPAGDVGTCQPQFEPGFRVGMEWAFDECAGVRIAYTQFESNTNDTLLASQGIGGTASSLVLVPGTLTAGTTFSELVANYGIDFRTADFEYSVIMHRSRNSVLNFDIGARYAHLQQDFSQLAEFAQPLGDRFTTSNISFDGGGLRTGLDGACQCGCSRFALYGSGFVDVLVGEFNSRYQQTNITTTDVEATSHWVDSRVMPILETEFGLQWTSCKGCLKLKAGYYNAFWFNAVDTAEYIQAVQNRSFTGVGQTITFSGLATHAEFCF